MIPDWLSGSALSAVVSAKADRRPRRGAVGRLRVPLAAAAVALAVFAGRIVEERLAARTALAEGEDAFRRGDFVRAADRFRSALEIDPASTAVRLRLVAAYQQQYVPGGESRANDDVARQALDEIARVLERDPSNRAAMLTAGEINDGRSDFDQACDWYRRLAAIDSSSAAAFAVTIDREHEGAMLTLAAWHQLAADLAASPDAYQRHMTSAGEWRHKALDLRRLKAQRGSS
jgi:tetratricopeptide (TPR) repeat protein